VLEWMCEKYFAITPYTVEPGVNTPMPMDVDNPREVGADRITKSVAAAAIYGPPLIVVDLGTATTFDCISAAGVLIGGAIAPGISTATEALVARAARLYRVEFVRPKEAIGRSTVTNLQSGVVYGYAGLVDGLVARMKAEMAGQAKVIATGGHAALIAEAARSIDHVNEDLGLEGLRLLYERRVP
jgi:type III pantothenate kinase